MIVNSYTARCQALLEVSHLDCLATALGGGGTIIFSISLRYREFNNLHEVPQLSHGAEL